MPVTPMFKRIAPELLALIADEVFRCGTGVVNGLVVKKLMQLLFRSSVHRQCYGIRAVFKA